MRRKFLNLIDRGLKKQVPATGLGVFRILFGLVILHEVIFLFYFRLLIFDAVPFVDTASPFVPVALLLWGIAAFCLTIGWYTRFAAVANYCFWVGFIVFTPMWKEFYGGFDQLMTGSSFLLIFLPSERALSIDNLRLALRYSTPSRRYRPPDHVSVLAYYIPIGISLGLLYLDAGIHKLSAPFWRNGLGPWLPSTMPYYISAIDMSWLLNIKPLQMLVGYVLMVFQFVFVFLCYFRRFRVPLLCVGAAFHIGIILSLNIYPFGFGMLVHYVLMVPFSWWRALRARCRFEEPLLTVFYDELCPLCNRTVIVVEHFDLLQAIEFKGLQTHARDYHALDRLSDDQLLKDLYALDRQGDLYNGLDTYIQILLKMRYTVLLGMILKMPGIYRPGTRVYRHVADSRGRLVCDESCVVAVPPPVDPVDVPLRKLYRRFADTDRKRAGVIAQFLVLVFILQLNSTLQYAVLYRLGVDLKATETGRILKTLSDSAVTLSHVFLGITPHALYMHDHFAGYDHLLGLTYRGPDGQERWLPFVNEEGRIVAPNWGRIQSMWANVAVTATIKRERLDKFLVKVTAFWGTKLGLDLSDATFTIKMKEVRAPMEWEPDLRSRNIDQSWRNIGKVIWRNGSARIEIPDIDLEALSAR